MEILDRIRPRLERAAQVVVALTAAALPWSTSATAILVVVWLCLILPALTLKDIWDEIGTAEGGFPVLLVALAVAGLFWSPVGPILALRGLDSFLKLLAIPILFAQFQRVRFGILALAAYLSSCILLLISSYIWVLWRTVPLPTAWPRPAFLLARDLGVPVRDYIAQSGEFTLCIFAFLGIGIHLLAQRRIWLAACCGILGLGFLLNLTFIITAKTSIVVLPILFVFLVIRHFGGRAAVLLLLCGGVFAIALLATSPYLRFRTSTVWTEAQSYFSTGARTSTGVRLEYWKKAAEFVATAPVMGHGTGSITELYQHAVTGSGLSAETTANPHNQTAAVAIQLGLLGAFVLWAIWFFHYRMFRAAGIPAWIGSTLVIQNVVGSLFNSHIFDFSQGWTYVIGVGVAGGMMRSALSRGQLGTERSAVT